jgi:hypothetical protein
MWGLRSPTPRGRTESCTLRILTDALTGAHGKALHVGIYRAGPFLQPQAGSFTQGVGQQVRRSRIPIRRAAGCDVTLHRLPSAPAPLTEQ